eukprot:scaffold24_cov245-Pinguiococcus_pyrenoidosus.AAC.15
MSSTEVREKGVQEVARRRFGRVDAGDELRNHAEPCLRGDLLDALLHRGGHFREIAVAEPDRQEVQDVLHHGGAHGLRPERDRLEEAAAACHEELPHAGKVRVRQALIKLRWWASRSRRGVLDSRRVPGKVRRRLQFRSRLEIAGHVRHVSRLGIRAPLLVEHTEAPVTEVQEALQLQLEIAADHSLSLQAGRGLLRLGVQGWPTGHPRVHAHSRGACPLGLEGLPRVVQRRHLGLEQFRAAERLSPPSRCPKMLHVRVPSAKARADRPWTPEAHVHVEVHHHTARSPAKISRQHGERRRQVRGGWHAEVRRRVALRIRRGDAKRARHIARRRPGRWQTHRRHHSGWRYRRRYCRRAEIHDPACGLRLALRSGSPGRELRADIQGLLVEHKAQMRREDLLAQAEVSILPTEVGELEPAVEIVLGHDDHTPDAQDALPGVNVAPASLQAVPPFHDQGLLHALGLLLAIRVQAQLLVLDDLFHLGELLGRHHGVVRTTVAFRHQRREGSIEEASAVIDVLGARVKVPASELENGVVQGALDDVEIHCRDLLVHQIPAPQRERRPRPEGDHLLPGLAILLPFARQGTPRSGTELQHLVPLSDGIEAFEHAKESRDVLGVVLEALAILPQRLLPLAHLHKPAFLHRHFAVGSLLGVLEHSARGVGLIQLLVDRDKGVDAVFGPSLELQLFVVQSFRVGVALERQLRKDADVDWQGLDLVLHELGEIEQDLQNLGRNGGASERDLQGSDQVQLVPLPKFVPAGHEGAVEELPGQGGIDLGKLRARPQSRRRRLLQERHAEAANPLVPVVPRRSLRHIPCALQGLLIDMGSRDHARQRVRDRGP